MQCDDECFCLEPELLQLRICKRLAGEFLCGESQEDDRRTQLSGFNKATKSMYRRTGTGGMNAWNRDLI
eukprot:767028-Hanusia_phi.AAC.5